jgi:two-component system cell cycle sensor histidine kinase/response regulator CckA
LVVDDTEDVRKLICFILAQNGYKVLEASNGLEALQISGTYSQPIHLVLTDVVMPQMSGGELAERLRGVNPNQRLIFMSGYAEETLLERAESETTFLAKPFTSLTLVKKIREVLDSPCQDGFGAR